MAITPYRRGGPVVPVVDGGTGAADATNARTNIGLATISQVEAETGTATTERSWTAQRVNQAIAALDPLQINGFVHFSRLSASMTDSLYPGEPGTSIYAVPAAGRLTTVAQNALGTGSNVIDIAVNGSTVVGGALILTGPTGITPVGPVVLNAGDQLSVSWQGTGTVVANITLLIEK